MPITAHSHEKSHVIIFGSGIPRCPMFHQDFSKALSDKLSRKWNVYSYHESRVEEKIKNSGTLEQLAELWEFKPIEMSEQAKEIVNDAIKAAPDTQEEFPFILYSYDCMLAPYIQHELNQRDKRANFTLIDGVPLSVAQQQAKQQILLNFYRIIFKVSKLLHYPVDDLDEHAVIARISILDNSNMNDALKELFEFTLPDFPNMTKVNELKSVYQDFACFPLTILPLILANTQSLLTSKYTKENAAKLEQALVISTQSTCLEYKQDSTLGWDTLMQSEGIEVLHLSSLNHFNVIQTIHDKKPMLDEYELVNQTILHNLPLSAITASPMVTPQKGVASPPCMSLHTPPPSPVKRGIKRSAEGTTREDADSSNLAGKSGVTYSPTRQKKRAVRTVKTLEFSTQVSEFLDILPRDKDFWTMLITERNKLCVSPICLSKSSSGLFAKSPQKPDEKGHAIQPRSRAAAGAKA